MGAGDERRRERLHRNIGAEACEHATFGGGLERRAGHAGGHRFGCDEPMHLGLAQGGTPQTQEVDAALIGEERTQTAIAQAGVIAELGVRSRVRPRGRGRGPVVRVRRAP